MSDLVDGVAGAGLLSTFPSISSAKSNSASTALTSPVLPKVESLAEALPFVVLPAAVLPVVVKEDTGSASVLRGRAGPFSALTRSRPVSVCLIERAGSAEDSVREIAASAVALPASSEPSSSRIASSAALRGLESRFASIAMAPIASTNKTITAREPITSIQLRPEGTPTGSGTGGRER